MALPNLCSPSCVAGKNAALALGVTAAPIVSNAANSAKTVRVISLYVANVDSTGREVTAIVRRGAETFRLAFATMVDANKTAVLITKETPVYLMEGHSIELSADAASALEAVVNYEEIASDTYCEEPSSSSSSSSSQIDSSGVSSATSLSDSSSVTSSSTASSTTSLSSDNSAASDFGYSSSSSDSAASGVNESAGSSDVSTSN